MKKQVIIIDITNNACMFCPGNYRHIRDIFHTKPSLSHQFIKIAIVKIKKYFALKNDKKS